jgi:hypothetical protein
LKYPMVSAMKSSTAMGADAPQPDGLQALTWYRACTQSSRCADTLDDACGRPGLRLAELHVGRAVVGLEPQLVVVRLRDDLPVEPQQLGVGTDVTWGAAGGAAKAGSMARLAIASATVAFDE